MFFLIFNRSEGLCYREVTRSENLGGELYVNVTLDDEFHGKDFISHKQKISDQFGTKINIVPLS